MYAPCFPGDHRQSRSARIRVVVVPPCLSTRLLTVSPLSCLSPPFLPLRQPQGQGPYARQLKKIETEIADIQKRVNEKIGIKESDTGLAAPNLWDIQADKVGPYLELWMKVSWASPVDGVSGPRCRPFPPLSPAPSGGGAPSPSRSLHQDH